MCTSTFKAWQLPHGGLVFREAAEAVAVFDLPCGRCTECKVSRARDISTRLVHEGYAHSQSIAATLTYSPEQVPAFGSLSKRHVQLFLKRLRKQLAKQGVRIRFDAVGEYSPTLHRPHYHVILFGYWPEDAKPAGKSGAGNPQFSSESLDALWGHGLVRFQLFSGGAAAYSAGYTASKVHKSLKPWLRVFDDEGVQIAELEDEFRLCSTRPGLGAAFYAKHREQLLHSDFSVVDGRRVPVPKYYDKLTKRSSESEAAEIKARRSQQAAQRALRARELNGIAEADPARCEVRDTVARAQLGMKARIGVAR